MKKILYAIISFCFVVLNTIAQPVNLSERNSISLVGGAILNSNTTVIANTSGTEVETNIIGMLEYRHWFDNEWSASFKTGIFGAESNTGVTGVESTAIIPVLFGISFYPDKISLGKTGRFYLGVNTGLYHGTASSSGVSFNNVGTSSVSESVFGISPNVGIDFIAGNWLRIGPNFSYHFISEFDEVIGSKKDYSGSAFTITFGILF